MKASQKVGDDTPTSEIGPRHVIDPAVAPHRRQDPERNADHQRQEEADRRQLEGRRRELLEIVEDGALRRDRDAEIAVYQPPQEQEVAMPESAGRGPTLARHSATNALLEAATSPSCARIGSPGTVLAIRKITRVASTAMTTVMTSRDAM